MNAWDGLLSRSCVLCPPSALSGECVCVRRCLLPQRKRAMARLVKSERTLQRARRLRRDMSDEERILWMLLRDRRFAEFKFRRQAPLGDYVVDFVCFERKL